MQIDLSGVERMDTAGAWLVERLVNANKARGVATNIAGQSPEAAILLDEVERSAQPQDGSDRQRQPFFIVQFLEVVGRGVFSIRDDFMSAMFILGATIRGGQIKAGRGHKINFAAIVHQIHRMGVGAIPVVVLMSSIVGAIVAQQGAFQLSYFGADIFVVDLVGILVLRELGVLMTAIMIAGRSGSAITAEIGSMKMREEVDALQVIGLNPVGVLVFPRLVALVISLPCLTIAANFAAIAGAILVSWIYSDIPPAAFIDRMRLAINSSTIFAGLIKAPFMALIIGIIASVEGMKVGGSAKIAWPSGHVIGGQIHFCCGHSRWPVRHILRRHRVLGEVMDLAVAERQNGLEDEREAVLRARDVTVSLAQRPSLSISISMYGRAKSWVSLAVLERVNRF